MQSDSFPQDDAQKQRFWLDAWIRARALCTQNERAWHQNEWKIARTNDQRDDWILHPLLRHSMNSNDVSNTTVNPQVREILFLS